MKVKKEEGFKSQKAFEKMERIISLLQCNLQLL